MSSLKDKYFKEVVPALQKKFKYKSPMQVPRLEKVVINMGLGTETRENPKAIESAVQDLMTISGQKPVVTRARKSVANFKVREGMQVGCKVTIRETGCMICGEAFQIALPRVRDFRGFRQTPLTAGVTFRSE